MQIEYHNKAKIKAHFKSYNNNNRDLKIKITVFCTETMMMMPLIRLCRKKVIHVSFQSEYSHLFWHFNCIIKQPLLKRHTLIIISLVGEGSKCTKNFTFKGKQQK